MMSNYLGMLAKLQTAKGAPATLTTANSMAVTDLTLTPYAGDVVSSNLVKAHMGANKEFKVGQHVILTFSLEVNGSGTAVTPPAYGELLKASGHIETIDTTTGMEEVVYSMTPTQSLENTQYITLEYYERERSGLNVKVKRIENARGVFKGAKVSEKGFLTYEFEFIGDFASTTEQANMPAFTYSAFKAPIPISKDNTPVAKFFGSDVCLSSMGLTPNLSHSYKDRPNCKGHEYDGSSRQVAWDVSFEAINISTLDVYGKWESHTGVVETGTAKIQHGTETGQVVIIEIGQSQITDVSSSDGIYSVSCNALAETDAQEYTITCK